MKTKRNPAFSDKLLKALAIGGVVTIAAVNPFFGVLASYVVREELRKRKWRRFKDDLFYLKRRGFIEITNNSGGSYKIKTTASGRQQVNKYNLRDLVIAVPKKWDKQWRLVLFDIPIAKQKARFLLLAKLKRLGFIMLQKSVWAYPFECQKEISILVKTLEVNKYVHQLTCGEILAGDYLREKFEKTNNIKLV